MKQIMYAGRRPAVSEKPAMNMGAMPCMICYQRWLVFFFFFFLGLVLGQRVKVLTKYVVTVISTLDVDTPRADAMVSNAGKYILDDRGE